MSGFGGVSIIDVASLTVTSTIPGSSLAVAVHPDGTRAYAAGTGGIVRVIDTASDLVVATVSTGLVNAVDLQVLADGSRLYVSDFNDEAVAVVDLTSLTVTSTIPLPSGAPGGILSIAAPIAALPDSSLVYAANSNNGTVSVIDTSTDAIVQSVAGFDPPIFGVTVSADGAFLYVSDAAGITRFGAAQPLGSGLQSAPNGAGWGDFVVELDSFCGDGVVEGLEECDDGANPAGGDCCSAGCEFEIGSCDDGDACTTGDTCDGMGECVPGGGTSCDDGNPCTQDSCDSGSGCANATVPRNDCRGAGASIFQIRDRSDDRADRLGWRWLKGESTSEADFADPLAAANYAFCLYAGTVATIVDQSVLPADADRWRSVASGFRWSDRALGHDGIAKVQLRAGTSGKPRISVRGRGANLSPPGLPLDLPVTLQLSNSETGVCWAASYDTDHVRENSSGRFKARRVD